MILALRELMVIMEKKAQEPNRESLQHGGYFDVIKRRKAMQRALPRLLGVSIKFSFPFTAKMANSNVCRSQVRLTR